MYTLIAPRISIRRYAEEIQLEPEFRDPGYQVAILKWWIFPMAISPTFWFKLPCNARSSTQIACYTPADSEAILAVTRIDIYYFTKVKDDIN